jgi:hypothetical protein
MREKAVVGTGPTCFRDLCGTAQQIRRRNAEQGGVQTGTDAPAGELTILCDAVRGDNTNWIQGAS